MSVEYDEYEWTTMLYAPLWVFAGIVGIRDEDEVYEVEDREWDTLFATLKAARNYRNDLSRDVFMELAEDFEEILGEFSEEGTDVEEGLSEVADILDNKEMPDVALGFKADIMVLTVNAAKSAGGRLFCHGVGDEEKVNIAYISSAIDMDEDALYAILEDAGAL